MGTYWKKGGGIREKCIDLMTEAVFSLYWQLWSAEDRAQWNKLPHPGLTEKLLEAFLSVEKWRELFHKQMTDFIEKPPKSSA